MQNNKKILKFLNFSLTLKLSPPLQEHNKPWIFLLYNNKISNKDFLLLYVFAIRIEYRKIMEFFRCCCTNIECHKRVAHENFLVTFWKERKWELLQNTLSVAYRNLMLPCGEILGSFLLFTFIGEHLHSHQQIWKSFSFFILWNDLVYTISELKNNK